MLYGVAGLFREKVMGPPRRSRVRGRIYQLLSYLLAVVGLVGLGGTAKLLMYLKETVQVDGSSAGPVVLLVVSLVLILAVSLNLRARRHLAPTAEEKLSKDGRAPVVYLRPFAEDKLADQKRETEMHRDLLRGGWGSVGPSDEEHLVAVLHPVGPSVAIGRPGDPLPELGAARVYVSDDAWQSQVVDWIERAAAIVLVAGESEGLRWEVDQVLARVPPERVLFLLSRTSKTANDPLLVALKEHHGASLAKCGHPRALMFDAEWAPIPLAWRSAWTQRRAYAKTLAPFVKRALDPADAPSG